VLIAHQRKLVWLRPVCKSRRVIPFISASKTLQEHCKQYAGLLIKIS